jgi:hypothetical protein
MPSANDAELTELYTSETDEVVEDNEPNTGEVADPPATTFDLHLQAVAGDNIGSSGANYTLLIQCIDETLAEPADPSMSPGTLPQQFDNAVGNDWVKAGTNFVKEQKFTIPVPSGVRGHVFRYVASLVSDNNDQVSYIKSNRFILV